MGASIYERCVGPILHKALLAPKDRPIPSKNVRRLRRVFSGGEARLRAAS
jgi:hypothetical protein